MGGLAAAFLTGKQTLESLNPGLLEPFLPTDWEMILKFVCFVGKKLKAITKTRKFYHGLFRGFVLS